MAGEAAPTAPRRLASSSVLTRLLTLAFTAACGTHVELIFVSGSQGSASVFFVGGGPIRPAPWVGKTSHSLWNSRFLWNVY